MTARRSPLIPGASESAIAPRTRSAMPPSPPRRPTTVKLLVVRMTWTPWRRRYPASSNPSSSGRGSTISTIDAQESALRRRATCREVEPRPLARGLAHQSAARGRARGPRTGFAGSDRSPREARGRPGRSPTEARCGRERPGGRCPTTSRPRRAQPPGLRGGGDALRVRRRRARLPPRERVTTMPAQRESFRGRRTERLQEGEAPGSASQPHRSTRSRSSSSVAGPIPGTASSSSTDPNAPCSDL